ncbi:50S ribosomal protein L29 [Candidatus Saccharibacteria bacterium]|jgi:ribosomal protein L29|nr:50S ribosomal protein L29 [Candidatus Saccharibacteria bacterium]
MAEKKATKPAEEVKTLEQLREDLALKRQELVDSTRGHRAGELQNPRVLKATRKDIARLLTAINAAEASEEGDK